jgi:hypothetical protein
MSYLFKKGKKLFRAARKLYGTAKGAAHGGGTGQSVGGSTVSQSSTGSSQGFGKAGKTKAKTGVNNVYAPHDVNKQYVNFERANVGTPFLTAAEVHEGVGNGYHVHQTRQQLLTGSGRVVRPEQLVGTCDVCGGLEDRLWRCEDCNLPLCRMHARQLNNRVLCPEHLQESIDDYDAWDARDCGYTIAPRPRPVRDEKEDWT